MFADVADAVHAAPAEDLALALDGPEAGALRAEPDNLVLRAARALAEAAGVPARAALTLTKVLPVASGIGGGSADAAAALRALNALWGLGWDEARLAAQALALGADVPACVGSRPCRMGGNRRGAGAGAAYPGLRIGVGKSARCVIDARGFRGAARRILGRRGAARGLAGCGGHGAGSGAPGQ